MKRVFILAILFSILVSCNKKAPNVLLFIEDGSSQLGYMLTHEVGKMIEILKKSGFEVTTATISGEILKTDSITLQPDLKLGEVNVDNYAGFILPCMAAIDTLVTSEEIAFVKKVVDDGKPIAAQLGAVLILAKAGVLNGKKFTYMDEETENIKMFPDFRSGIYCGRGVVQDGTIITSGTCPWMAKSKGYKDGTSELTNAFVDVIKTRNK